MNSVRLISAQMPRWTNEKCEDENCRTFQALVSQGLVEMQWDGVHLSLVPGLALRWDELDGTKFRFHLAKDAPITSRDVVRQWSEWLRHCSLLPANSALFQILGADQVCAKISPTLGRGVQIEDDKTFVVVLKKPSSHFVWALADPHLRFSPYTYPNSGPFVVSYESPDYLRLKKNPWQKRDLDSAMVEPLNQIEWFCNSSEESRYHSVLGGEIDMDLEPSERTLATSNPAWRLEAPDNVLNVVSFAKVEPPFHVSDHRRAFFAVLSKEWTQEFFQKPTTKTLLPFQEASGAVDLSPYEQASSLIASLFKVTPPWAPNQNRFSSRVTWAALRPAAGVKPQKSPSVSGKGVQLLLGQHAVSWTDRYRFHWENAGNGGSYVIAFTQLDMNPKNLIQFLESFLSPNQTGWDPIQDPRFKSALEGAQRGPTWQNSVTALKEVERLILNQEIRTLPLSYEISFILRRPEIQSPSRLPAGGWDLRSLKWASPMHVIPRVSDPGNAG